MLLCRALPVWPLHVTIVHNLAAEGLQCYKIKLITNDGRAHTVVHAVTVVKMLVATVAGGGATGHECR